MAGVGRIRRRVRFINMLQGKDYYGSFYTDPITHFECWAFRRKLGSAKDFVQYATAFANSYEYEIYYHSGVVIDVNYIMVDITEDEDEFEIVSIRLTGDKKVKWVLTCNQKAEG